MAHSGTPLVPTTSSASLDPPNDDPGPDPPASRRPYGPGRLAALLLARKDQLLRGRKRRGSSCSSCGRNTTLSLSDSESLAGSSKRSHDNLSRNSSSSQSAATVQTLISSSPAHRDARYSDKRMSRFEDLGDDNVIDGLQVIAEKEMNSFQRHIPGLQRHDVKTSTIRQHYYPEGGWGWVVCGCVFAIQVLTSGVQFSFGVLYTDLVKLVGSDKALQACWVGGSCLAVSRVFSPLVVALCRRKSTRLTAVIGGLVVALAILFTSFAIHLHQVFLSWAVVLGIGIGMTRETANLMLGQYFKRRREFVEIIAQSGSGIGITLFSVFFKETIRTVGWRLGLQAVTCAVFSAFFLGIFYRSASLYHPQRRAILHLKNQKKKQVKDKKKVGVKPPYFDISSLKMRSVQVLLLSSALVSAGIYAPLFFLIYGAQMEGMEDSSLILLQTFLGFAYALGCIGVGIIVVHRSSQCLISRQYLCQACFFGLGITILSLTAIRGYYGYVLFMWLYGLQLGGAHYSIKMLTLEKVRARQFSRAWGFIQGGTALPILFGVPITGYINASSSKSGYFFSSFMTIAGASTLYLMNIFKSQMNPPDTSVSFTTVESHLPPDIPPFSVPLESGGDGGQKIKSGGQPMLIPANMTTSMTPYRGNIIPPFRDPICTCGADYCGPPLSTNHITNLQCSRNREPHGKRLNRNISFASSAEILEPPRHQDLAGCMSDEAIFEHYYDYIGDGNTKCNTMDNTCGYSDFDRECQGMMDGHDKQDELCWRSRGYSQYHSPRGYTNSLGRKLKQSSVVSFSEPEGLARLGQHPARNQFSYPLVYQQIYSNGHHSTDFHPIPPIPRPPCIRGSLPRMKRGTLVDEITTSV